MPSSSAACHPDGRWHGSRRAPSGRWCPASLAGPGGVQRRDVSPGARPFVGCRFQPPRVCGVCMVGLGRLRTKNASWPPCVLHLFGSALPSWALVTGILPTGKPGTHACSGWRRTRAALNRMGFNNTAPSGKAHPGAAGLDPPVSSGAVLGLNLAIKITFPGVAADDYASSL